MNSENIIVDYQRLILKEQSANLSTSYFCYNQQNNHKLALDLFRYVVEEVLSWTPDDVFNKIDINIIKDYHLLVPFKYLIFPEELNKRKDCFYIAHLLYPDTIPYSTRDFVVVSYQKVLSKENGKFSKSFYLGVEGELRACICLQYLLQNYLSFHSIEEMYYYFSKPAAMSTLRHFRLANACQEFFDTPLDFLHNSLPRSQKNELYYQFYRFDASLREKKLKTKVKSIIGN